MKKCVLLSFLVLSGCAKLDKHSIYPKQIQENQYNAYIAQVNAISKLNTENQQIVLNNSSINAEYKYKVMLEKEITKRVGIESPSQKKIKSKYMLPSICKEDSAKMDNQEHDEVCAALKEMHNSLKDEYGEPEGYSGGIVINAQGASDFAINVQSHGNTNEGRKSHPIKKSNTTGQMYVKKLAFPVIPQPHKGFWQSFSDNLFGSFDKVVDKVAEKSDVIGLAYVGGQLAKKSTTEIKGDLIGKDNNASRNDWQYEYTDTEEAELE